MDMVLLKSSFVVFISSVLVLTSPGKLMTPSPLPQVLSGEVHPFGVYNFKKIVHR